MEPDTLRSELIELVLLLQHLTPLHLTQLYSFLQSNPHDGWFLQMGLILQKLTNQQIEFLFKRWSKEQVDTGQADALLLSLQSIADEGNLSVQELEECYGLLMDMYYLQMLLQNMSVIQLMKLFEAFQQLPQILQTLKQVQQLFSQLQPEALLNMHRQVQQSVPGAEHQTLVQIVKLPLDHFQLYQPLRMLFQLDEDELLTLQQLLPKLHEKQLNQLVQLLQGTPIDAHELRNMFNPVSEFEPAIPPKYSVSTPLIPESSIPAAPAPPEKKFALQIVEQPPEKSVYKRNLKPNPMVRVSGDGKLAPNLFVAVTLVRCDTFAEEPKFLTGNRPEKVTSGRVITFRKLKVTTTSHQQQETLFCLKFELRKYNNETEYEVLDGVHSNPICVLSHSTQMKPAPTTAPVITEVIPPCGPVSGGTRVAILGSNFVESPAARIKFDAIDVMPIFHAPGTLICHTPQHTPGTVNVKVCNSNKKWSDTAAAFTYDPSFEAAQSGVAETLMSRSTTSPRDSPSIHEAAWSNNIDSVRRLQEGGTPINAIDTRGYTVLHYACAQGYLELASLALEQGANPDILDRKGFSSLMWAIAFGNQDLVQTLLDFEANPDLQDYEGLSPLMMAVLSGSYAITNMLLEYGADPNVCGLNGETPLHVAAIVGQENIIQLLVQNGAFLNAADMEGDTPLHWAVRESQLDSVKSLISLGCCVDALNEEDETPLHLAVLIGHLNLADALLSLGAHAVAAPLEGFSLADSAEIPASLTKYVSPSESAIQEHYTQDSKRNKHVVAKTFQDDVMDPLEATSIFNKAAVVVANSIYA